MDKVFTCAATVTNNINKCNITIYQPKLHKNQLIYLYITGNEKKATMDGIYV